jgi:hypothetical protein
MSRDVLPLRSSRLVPANVPLHKRKEQQEIEILLKALGQVKSHDWSTCSAGLETRRAVQALAECS